MGINSKKYKDIKDEYYPDNGNLLNYYLTSQRISKSQLAKGLDVTPVTLNKYFKRESLQFGILWKISKILDYNLIARLGEYLQIPYETQAETRLKQQLAEKEAQINAMMIQLQVYKDLKG